MQYIKDGDFYTLVDPDLGVFSMGEKDEVVPELLQYTSHYQHIPSTVYQCSYGWLCTAYEPLSLPETGEMFARAGIDIGMNQIYKERHLFLVNSIALVLLLSGICIFINLYLIRNIAVLPLTRLTDAAKGFGQGKDEYTLDDVIEVDIRSNDEISDLYQTIRGMQTRMVQYTDDMKALTAEKSRVGTELQLAANIQTAMLQNEWPAFPDRHEFSLHASMAPAREVGGDFYDFFLIDDDHLALVMADVSGKGVPAALFMMVTKILINERTLSGDTPAEILSVVNDRICANNDADMFVTVWLGILEISTGKITAANAGHDDPAVYRAGGEFAIVKNRHGPVIGAMEGMVYHDFTIDLQPGDKLFLYTDGVPEATNADEKMFTLDGMLNVLNESRDLSPQEILGAVWDRVNAFVGDAPQFDDLTMLCIELKELGSDMKTRVFPAENDKLHEVSAFVGEYLEAHDCPMKTQMQIDLCLEEVFVNIANYAYGDGKGDVKVRLRAKDNTVTLTLIDKGKAFDPLQREDPDVSLSAEARKIGGLGIFLVKKNMDKVDYRREDDKNIITMRKSW
jgi:sigma-B regulation protein RsbU (phosphoserine phosphatase)